MLTPVKATPRTEPVWSYATTRLERSSRRRLLEYGILSGFLVVASLVAVHLVWAQSHARPPVVLNDNLGLRDEGTFSNSGLEGGFRVVEANGQRVGDRSDLHRILDARREQRMLVRARRPLEGANQERIIVWIPATSVPHINVEEDLTASASALDPALGKGNVRIVEINGKVPATRTDAAELLYRPRGMTRLTVASRGRDDPPTHLVFFFRSWPVQWSLWIAGLCFGLLGWVVVFLKPQRRSSWGFAAFALGGGLFSLVRSIPHPYRLSPEAYLYLILQVSIPALIVAFLATFTPLRHLVGSVRPWIYGAAGFGAVLLTLDLILYRDSATVGLLGDALFVAWLLGILALVLIAQPADLYFRLRGARLGATDRQRARVLRWSTLGALVPAPVFFLGIYSGAAGLDARLWVEIASLILPISIAYAILRHNLLEINELLREGLLAGTLLLGLGITYAASAAGLVPLAASLLPSRATWVLPTVIMATIILLTPLYLRGRAAIRGRFERPSPDFGVLAQAFDETIQAGTTAQEFCDSAVRRISRAAGLAEVQILLGSEKQDAWWLAATTRLVVGDGPDHDRAAGALALLRFRQQPVVRDDLIEEMSGRVGHLAALAGMRELGASLLLPLISRGRLLGALAVGDRLDGTNLTAGDLRLLEHVRGRLAQQLDYLHQEYEARMRARRIVDLFPDSPPRIGPFEIDRVIGEGGTSFVYLGRNAVGPAAIKVPNDKVQSNQRAMQRFRRESLAMQRLDHPNIARVLDVGWHGREPYIAFEYFHRGSFDQRLEAVGRLAERDALGVALQVVAALAAALDAGVLHRDVKLRNLFLADDGTVKLGDFGLALVEDATTLTTHPVLMGTPAYMSPEQASGKPATWKSDQYALGICLYELLAGERPFWAETADVLLFLHVHQPLPDIGAARPDVTLSTHRLLERMTAKSPVSRFESYADLAEALQAGTRG